MDRITSLDQTESQQKLIYAFVPLARVMHGKVLVGQKKGALCSVGDVGGFGRKPVGFSARSQARGIELSCEGGMGTEQVSVEYASSLRRRANWWAPA